MVENCTHIEIEKVLQLPPIYARKANTMYIVPVSPIACEAWVTGKSNTTIKKLDITNTLLLTHTHEQTIPNNTWTGIHNLGRKITAVHVTDTGGNQWECIFDSTETTFSINVGLAAFAGTAILM